MLGSKILIVFAIAVVGQVWGHGMLMDPPNRSSLWRFDPTSPPNYNDNENFCGGYGVQWHQNGGKCGVCGDDWKVKQPRPNENTGKYGEGKIVKEYKQGSIISANVLLSANHMGYFTFSICNLLTPDLPEQDDCFQLLKTADGKDKYVLPSREKGYYKVDLQLPAGLTCKQCVLRWHYNTGNTWGQCEDGTHATGCGPQETFRSCSDIAIV